MSAAAEVFLIAGLGNPGRDYRAHRHNVGFMLLDRLAEEHGMAFSRRRSEALVAEGWLDGRKLILAKPQTYMNLAGRSVAPLVRFHRLPLSNVLVVCDDLDLPPGALRLRAEGGSAGHNGLRSIFAALGSQAVPRLRVGIGRPPGRMDPAAFVLRPFDRAEAEVMEITLPRGVECVEAFVLEGIQHAMTRFNRAAEAE